jgi:hypothetical protein
MSSSRLDTPAAVAAVLSNAGYSASASESATFLELLHNGAKFPAVIQFQRDEILVSCQVGEIGDFDPEQLSLVAINTLAANIQTLPYAFALLKPETGADVEAVNHTPLVLVNSVPTGDLSEEELLWAVRKLQTALAVGAEAIATAVSVSAAS